MTKFNMQNTQKYIQSPAVQVLIAESSFKNLRGTEIITDKDILVWILDLIHSDLYDLPS